MGSAPSRAEREACAAAPASRHTLSEREAFDLATLWHRELTGFVLMDVDSHYRRDYSKCLAAQDQSADDLAVIDHLEWIEFKLSRPSRGDYQDAIGAARAATLAWFALSCCPGFGGDENPEFWKRVFSALLRCPPDCLGLCRGTLTGAQPFFAHPDRPFPRVRFAWFKGLPIESLWETPLSARNEKRLSSALRKLAPFRIRDREQRTIEVAIRVSKTSDASELIEKLQGMALTHHAGSEASQLQFSTLYCDSVAFSIACLSTVARFPHARVYVLRNYEPYSLNGPTGQAILARLLASPSGLAGPAAPLDIRNLSVGYGNTISWEQPTGKFPKWCSVLPHTSAVAGIFPHPEDVRDQSSLEIPGAWLGYALFHPDAAIHDTTSATNLTLRLTSRHRLFVSSLRRMREGNNLLLAMALTTKETTGYHQARVRCGTVVREAPDRETDLHTFPHEGWITLCVVVEADEPCDVDLTQPWVRVVLPGHGLAWVASEDILEIVSRAAGSSRVRRLRLVIGNRGEDDRGGVSSDMMAILSEVLSELGANLTYLHVEGDDTQLDATAIRNILHCCPNLTSLHVPHDGLYWTDSKRIEAPLDRPRLQELELSILRTLQPLDSPLLSDLRVLRIKCEAPGRHDSNREALHAILARFRALRYFIWWCPNIVIGIDSLNIRYDAHCAEMWRLLAPEPSTRILKTADIAFGLDTRLAFLSVARHTQTRTSRAIASLPQDALVLIFRFSTSSVRRQICIRDYPIERIRAIERMRAEGFGGR